MIKKKLSCKIKTDLFVLWQINSNRVGIFLKYNLITILNCKSIKEKK